MEMKLGWPLGKDRTTLSKKFLPGQFWNDLKKRLFRLDDGDLNVIHHIGILHHGHGG